MEVEGKVCPLTATEVEGEQRAKFSPRSKFHIYEVIHPSIHPVRGGRLLGTHNCRLFRHPKKQSQAKMQSMPDYGPRCTCCVLWCLKTNRVFPEEDLFLRVKRVRLHLVGTRASRATIRARDGTLGVIETGVSTASTVWKRPTCFPTTVDILVIPAPPSRVTVFLLRHHDFGLTGTPPSPYAHDSCFCECLDCIQPPPPQSLSSTSILHFHTILPVLGMSACAMLE